MKKENFSIKNVLRTQYSISPPIIKGEIVTPPELPKPKP